MSVLVIGNGEVGKPLVELVKKNCEQWYVLDKGQSLMEAFWGPVGGNYEPTIFCSELEMHPERAVKFMHICIPEQPGFIKIVLDFANTYKPKHIIIHSTTTPGVCCKIQDLLEPKMPETVIYSSPVRGNHRDGMMDGLLTYWKYIAPARWEQVTGSHAQPIEEDIPRCDEAAAHLEALGLQVRRWPCATDLEWAKTLDLGFYGVAIAFYQVLERMCEQHGLGYGVIKEFIETTPEQSNGKAQRLVFYGGYIGGHCVVPALQRLSVLERGLNLSPTESLFTAAMESNDQRLIELIDYKPPHHP